MNKQDLTALEDMIISSYETEVTLSDAERLAARFLHAQMQVSSQIKHLDLDARMRKSGVKAIRAAVYTEACAKTEKKPTESALEHIINTSVEVNGAQNAFDSAEVERDEMERFYNIFREAHIYFRGISKGRFE